MAAFDVKLIVCLYLGMAHLHKTHAQLPQSAASYVILLRLSFTLFPNLTSSQISIVPILNKTDIHVQCIIVSLVFFFFYNF